MDYKSLINENGWQITYEHKLGYFYVVERGYTTLIVYPRSDKFKEKASVKIGAKKRLEAR